MDITKQYQYETADSIRKTIETKSTIGALLRMTIDTIADQYISEEQLQRYPEILEFLIRAGSDNEELLWLYFIHKHPDVLRCKAEGCDGKIIGGCPGMWCEDCGKQYFLEVENLTPKMCTRCVADHIKECTNESRRRRHQIYVIDQTESN